MVLQSPAFSRNCAPIRDALAAQGFGDPVRRVLELGCGSGEHCVYFASAFPTTSWHPTDVSAAACASVDAYVREAGLEARISPATVIDVGADEWTDVPRGAYDGAIAVNVVHIMQHTAIPNFFRGAGRALRPGGRLCIYDTWTFDGAYVGPNNERFDRGLRDQGYGGVAAIEECNAAADAAGFDRTDVLYLPANNQLAVYSKRPPS